MESLESSQVGDAREVVAAMVLPVVHEGDVTPAMEAGIETRVWSIEEIVGLLDRRAEQAA